MDYDDDLLELVKRRRSIRGFKPEPIPEDYIDKILEAARWAPSGANSQPWEFIVVKDKELRDKIVQLQKEYPIGRVMELTKKEEHRRASIINPLERPGFANAPVFILLCGDPRADEAYPANACHHYGHDIFISGLASTFLYMHLAATSLGLASQWVSFVHNPLMACLIKQFLGIPERLEVYDMMAVGHPAYQPGPRIVRDKAEMVHYDGFDVSKFRSDEEMDKFITAIIAART
jgi:5,6-dimethylbenzimidazole synthase